MGGVSLCAAVLSILMCYIFKHKITIALASILTCSISIASYAISKQVSLKKKKILIFNFFFVI